MYINSITPPHTYAEWVEILDMLKRKEDDDAVVEAMYRGSIEWQSGVAQRFLNKLIAVINFRMDSATDKFQKEMGRAYGQERAIVQALIALRKELSFLSRAINLPIIPEEKRQECYQLVIAQANSIQKSLEESAKKDRTGKLASLVRNNRVNSL